MSAPEIDRVVKWMQKEGLKRFQIQRDTLDATDSEIVTIAATPEGKDLPFLSHGIFRPDVRTTPDEVVWDATVRSI